MSISPPVLDIHTPSSSFSLVHSLTQDSLQSLYDKLTRKVQSTYHGSRVSSGWLKYEFNETIWDLDDESDYTIFAWRQQQYVQEHDPLSTSSVSSVTASTTRTPTLHLHDPSQPLPVPPAYRNTSYYVFQPSRARNPSLRSGASSPRARSSMHRKSKQGKQGNVNNTDAHTNGVPDFKTEFNKFHSENGVRTVMGSIGPVQNVRMLLKSGYRHVYISRKFALEHGFIPADAAPGHYGYGGLVNIGTWPITLIPSALSNAHPDAPPAPALPAAKASDGTGAKKKSKGSKAEGKGHKPTLMTVYLAEEAHFDVVLGRSFFERRQIRTSAIDPTDVVCLDTGEKIECELVILKDGRGEIVTVT